MSQRILSLLTALVAVLALGPLAASGATFRLPDTGANPPVSLVRVHLEFNADLPADAALVAGSIACTERKTDEGTTTGEPAVTATESSTTSETSTTVAPTTDPAVTATDATVTPTATDATATDATSAPATSTPPAQ